MCIFKFENDISLIYRTLKPNVRTHSMHAAHRTQNTSRCYWFFFFCCGAVWWVCGSIFQPPCHQFTMHLTQCCFYWLFILFQSVSVVFTSIFYIPRCSCRIGRMHGPYKSTIHYVRSGSSDEWKELQPDWNNERRLTTKQTCNSRLVQQISKRTAWCIARIVYVFV